MIETAVVLAGGTLALGMARWLGLPSIPLLIVTGLALKSLPMSPSEEVLESLLLLGLAFLVFVAGTELNPKRLGKYRRSSTAVGLLQSGILGGAGLILAWYLA